MVLDLESEVIAKKVLLFYNRWALAELVTWTPARVRVKAELRCISRLVT